MTKLKSLPIELKAVGTKDGLEEGDFVGYASVFDVRDSYGDIVIKGAFADSLAAYGEKGAGIPAYWSHRMDDPTMNIGVTKSAVEDEHGLKVHVKLDLDSPNGAYVHKLIKEGRVTQMSFAYAVKEGAYVEPEDDDPFYEIRSVDIFEVSVVPIGANQETELLDVKSVLADLKAGRSLSAKTQDVIAQIRDLATGLLESAAPSDSSDEDSDDAKAEEPETVKAEELTESKSRTERIEAALSIIRSRKENG